MQEGPLSAPAEGGAGEPRGKGYRRQTGEGVEEVGSEAQGGGDEEWGWDGCLGCSAQVQDLRIAGDSSHPQQTRPRMCPPGTLLSPPEPADHPHTH